ncbi:Choline transport protein [Verticillium dahliae VDG2]|nr:Choline transport protein [Verticillium dahliae VDG2]
MVAGKLRRKRGEERALEGIAIVSNRCGHVHDVPWIGEARGEVYGLSNTSYLDPDAWPKVEDGKRLVREAVEQAVAEDLDEEALTEKLFGVLGTDTLPAPRPGQGFAEYIPQLKHSIFIPSIGDEHHRQAMVEATKRGKGEWDTDDKMAAEQLQRPDATSGENGIGFDTGMYGTQRQSVILVDWDGNVVFKERALWDSNGNPIPKGEGDVVFKYKIDGWDD